MRKVHTAPVTFGGPINPGSPYYNFKNDIKMAFKGTKPTEKDEISLRIKLFILKERVKEGKNDLDNFLKPIIDALNEIGLFDESNISSIHITRHKVDKKQEEGVEVIID